MTKKEQADIVYQASEKLAGTLMGDWLRQAAEAALSAASSDINPSVWVEGLTSWVASSLATATAQREADLKKQEADLKKRADHLAIKEADLERHTEHLHDAIHQASQKLDYLADHL